VVKLWTQFVEDVLLSLRIKSSSNVAVMEAQETQALAGQAQEDVMTEAMGPG